MKESEILLVKSSWRVFREIDPCVIGDAFYAKLFSRNQSLRKMFPREMAEQYQKLISMINMIISRLDKLDKLNEELKAMAHIHVQHGVRPGHYKLVGDALLWTLRQGMANDWNTELESAWKKCYTSISEAVLEVSV